jgi:hypothetical protein
LHAVTANPEFHIQVNMIAGRGRGLRALGWAPVPSNNPLLLARYNSEALLAAGWKFSVHWYTFRSTVTE